VSRLGGRCREGASLFCETGKTRSSREGRVLYPKKFMNSTIEFKIESAVFVINRMKLTQSSRTAFEPTSQSSAANIFDGWRLDAAKERRLQCRHQSELTAPAIG